MKILIVKPSSLGDVVQALPVLRLLKRHLPESEIYWWIEIGYAALLEGDQDLAGIIPFDRHHWAAPRRWPELWQTIRWARAQKFDWVIDLQSLARSGAFAWLANGKLTIGLDDPREGARGFYDLTVRRPFFGTHAVDWYLQVLPLLGVPSKAPFDWLPHRPKILKVIQEKWPVNGSPWIILQPGARWLNKRWPVESFVALTERITSVKPEFRFAILGSQQEKPLAETISRASPDRCLDLTGQTTLPEMIEWIRLSHLMVTNDTGPMHVAAALKAPTIALFGPTEPLRTGPYGQLDHVLQLDLPCAPCLRSRCSYSKPNECLRAISSEAVFKAVLPRLSLKA